MPTISQFYGIKIYIFYDDHNEPHLHAYYGEYSVEVTIKTNKRLNGKLPPRAMKLVKVWMKEHTGELMKNWQLAQQHKKLKSIKPLE